MGGGDPSVSLAPDGGPAAPPPAPVSGGESCNGLDDNGDGQVDEGCICKSGASQTCFPGPASKAGIGACRKGTMHCQGDLEFGTWGACEGAVAPAQEVCGNGIDEDCDGKDQPCAPTPSSAPDAGGAATTPPPPVTECTPNALAACYGGPAGTSGKGICKGGLKKCDASGKWGACVGQVLPKPEVCDNLVDEDCNGKNELCPGTVAVAVNIDGYCVTASCPPGAPYPVGCAINFSGGDSRGCIANAPGTSLVYFQEGDKCSAGHLSGVLFCSSTQKGALNAVNCPINKSVKYYPASKSGCPDT